MRVAHEKSLPLSRPPAGKGNPPPAADARLYDDPQQVIPDDGEVTYMADIVHGRPAADASAVARKLDAAGWGLFFIWLGMALLMDVSWGISLLGVGAIALLVQAARKVSGLRVEGFGLVIGVIFTLVGIAYLLELQIGEPGLRGGLVPILFVALGVALLVSALIRRKD